MNSLLFLLSMFFADGLQANHGSLDLWKSFVAAAQNEGLREDFHDKLQPLSETSLEHSAYFGAAKMLMAEIVFNPYSKYSYFIEGSKLLDRSIAEKSTDAELRYLRLMIQSKAPRMLNYRDQLEEDYTFIRSNIARSDKKLDWMISFEKFVVEHRKDFPPALIASP